MPLNQNGMSLVTVIIVMGIVGLSALSVMRTSDQKRKISHQMNVAVSASIVKEKLVGLVLSPLSWQATQAHNPQAFSGLSSAGQPSGGVSAPPSLDIYTPDSSTAYYQATNGQAGFDLKGNPCTGFSANGNDECPFRYEITLSNRVFQNANWIDTLHFALSFKPASSGLILNTGNSQFTFDLVRNLNDQSVEASCISIKGVYHPDTNSCSEKMTNAVATCDSGKTYRGPASNSTSGNCDIKTSSPTACAAGQVIKGFDSSGSPFCGT